MAAKEIYTKPQQKQPFSVFSDQKNQEKPNKFHSNFLYKALVVSVFLIILPLFPSQAPEFINQTLLTRSWELLHLLFVGIAISYGLFSRKNDDSEKDDKENNNNVSKFDNAQNYVSRFLQVSSVFDDETESPSDENKVQTWSSQYFRNEPVVVVAQDSEKNVSKSVEKPLLLPVRSLKETSSVPDHSSVSRSNSKRFSNNSNKSTNGDLMEEKLKTESIVLPSPIPWRSRSGRLEKREEKLESHDLFPSVEESEFSRVVQRSQSSRSFQPNSTSCSSPKIASAKKSSPSPSSLSLETQAKAAEDTVKKKSFYNKANPPPFAPPPPPPPPFYQSSTSFKPSPAPSKNGFSLEKEEYSKRSAKGFELVSSGKQVKDKAGFDRTCFDREEDELMEKVFEESDQEETESEEDNVETVSSFDKNFNGESGKRNEQSSSSSSLSSVGDEGPDVDKKADEFIARFREQIRLQRIESIKRSSAQISRKLAR